MSKKQKKSVENLGVPSEAYCKDCKFRKSGSKAKKENHQGLCEKHNKFVARKNQTCDKYKGK